MTFPHIPHQWTQLLFSYSLCTQYITQSLLLPHVVNIITFMSTLNNISLYLNTISPHRATILIKIPSPRRRDFFLLLFPGGSSIGGLVSDSGNSRNKCANGILPISYDEPQQGILPRPGGGKMHLSSTRQPAGGSNRKSRHGAR